MIGIAFKNDSNMIRFYKNSSKSNDSTNLEGSNNSITIYYHSLQLMNITFAGFPSIPLT